MRVGESEAVTILRHIGILADLTDEELVRVWKVTRRVEVKAGAVIMKEEEIGSTMFFFSEGEVDVTKSLTLKLGKKFGSAEKSMVKLKADAVPFFGEMAMFEDEPRSATITASSDCVLYEVKRNDFMELCAQYPGTGVKILTRIASTLCRRVRKGNEDVLKLTTALSIALSR